MREIRANLVPSEDGKIRGLAAVWDSWSHLITERGRTFRERIKRGALKPDPEGVSLWWMHDSKTPLANERSGTLKITETDEGLAFEADIGTTQRAEEIRDLVRRGVVSQMSIGFIADSDTWDGTTSRTITGARLHEVSLVETGRAAYPTTYANARKQKERTMSLRENRSKVEQLKAEYPNATDERQLQILEEVGDLEEMIAAERSAFDQKLKAAPAAVAAPFVHTNRIASKPKDELREWFRGGFRSERATSLAMTTAGGANTAMGADATMPVLSNEFVKALDQESVMRTLATVETRGADTDVAIISGRLTASLIAEGAAYSKQDMDTTKVSFTSYKSGVFTDITEEALQDTVWDLAGNVVQEHGRAHSRLWEGFYATGTNSGQPQGVFSASWATTQDTAATGLPKPDDLVNAAYKLNPAYMSSAVWLMNQATWANIVKESASGKYLLNGENGNILRDGAVALFLGKPVYISEFAPTAATANTISVLFGDFKRGYRIVDRSTVSFTVDDMSQRSSGLIRYSSRMRSDARAVDLSAVVRVRVKPS
jgi:HK97 family phage major capsid protein/HK97 family phage prohead protease